MGILLPAKIQTIHFMSFISSAYVLFALDLLKILLTEVRG